ncbi:hypothetical protein D9M68_573750 [compost metagenome]
MLAVVVEANESLGVEHGTLDMTQPFEARRRAANELRIGRAFEAALREAARVARFLDGLVEGGPLIEDGNRHGDAPIGSLRLPAE